MIDGYVTRSHYLDHLLPVWRALPADERGILWVSTRALEQRAADSGVEAHRGQPTGAGPRVLVAGYDDVRQAWGRRIIYLEHGAGQTYGGKAAAHPSYSGGRERSRIDLHLVPNATVAARCEQPAAVVGCPRLDALHQAHREFRPVPVLGLAWHFDLHLVPETRCAWPAWRSMVRSIADVWPGPVIGHAHPRLWPTIAPVYRAAGILPVAEVDEWLTRVDVVTFDNTSTGYEAAALGIPTVVLNAPWYRRDVEHGLRFWDAIPGPELDPTGDGPTDAEAVTAAAILAAAPYWREHSAAVAESVYPSETRGRAAALAVAAILAIP